MQIFREIAPLRTYLSEQNDLSLGLVPTMGALHAGHRALLTASLKDNDITVCSIYVNPTQFNNAADLENYPRALDRDLKFLKEVGCDAVFCPSDETMYPRGKDSGLRMSFGFLDQVLEGQHRPGHFSGVGLVVAKLLNMVRPHRVYFGQKDLQQWVVIRQLIDDLFYPIEPVRVPIVRSEQGLALSSRNERLSDEETQVATQLYQSLQIACQLVQQGSSIETAKQRGVDHLSRYPAIQIEYFEAVDAETFRLIKKVKPHQPVAFCVAAFVGEVRLIDNVLMSN